MAGITKPRALVPKVQAFGEKLGVLLQNYRFFKDHSLKL